MNLLAFLPSEAELYVLIVFCSTFWSTSRVKLTTSICFKTMQVLPVRKAPLPDRQGHLSTCSLYVLELKWICRFLSWKSHALTSNCCWRYLYDRTSCQSLITMIVVITMFHHQWNEWMNEWIIRNWYKLHQTRLHAAFKALNGSSTTNAHTQHGRGPFCLDRVVEKLILIPKTSRKSSQMHKVQFLNLFLVNFSIISYSFIFVHSFLSVLDFRTFRTSLLVISEVPGVQIRSLGNHSLSIDIFLVLLATCKIQKKKTEKYWKYMPKCKELSGLGDKPIREVCSSVIWQLTNIQKRFQQQCGENRLVPSLLTLHSPLKAEIIFVTSCQAAGFTSLSVFQLASTTRGFFLLYCSYLIWINHPWSPHVSSNSPTIRVRPLHRRSRWNSVEQRPTLN